MQTKLLIVFLIISASMNAQNKSQYANINGLNLYYEIHGEGKPLVLLHGGGSTIETTFGRVLPEFARVHQVIAVELQAHGRTADINRPLSFTQDADDVAALLKLLRIESADFIGFSNGGTTCLQIALRHPQLVNKMVIASAIFKRDGMAPGFFEGMKQATLANMPAPLKDAFAKVNPSQEAFAAMFNRDVHRMLHFEDIEDAQIRNIRNPVLVINGDREVVRTEHALELSRLLSNGRLCVIPGDHGEYIGEICALKNDHPIYPATVALIESFLK